MKLYRIQTIRQSRRFVSPRFSTPFRSFNCHSFVTQYSARRPFSWNFGMRGIRFRERGGARLREKSAANEFNFGDRLCGEQLVQHDTLLVSSGFVTFYAPLLDIFLVDNLERRKRRSNDRQQLHRRCIVSLLLPDNANPGDSLVWHGANICLRSCRRWNSDAFVGSWQEVLLSSRDPVRFFYNVIER